MGSAQKSKLSLSNYQAFYITNELYVYYRMSNIEVLFLKMLKNIENKCFFVNTWVYFQENIIHFDIHALTFRKIKRK